MSHFATVLLHVTRIQNSENKVIAVDNKEKPFLMLLMTVKLIVTLIEFRVLFTWEEEGVNIMEPGKVKIMLII